MDVRFDSLGEAIAAAIADAVAPGVYHLVVVGDDWEPEGPPRRSGGRRTVGKSARRRRPGRRG
jgi:hypothetical protein